VIAVKVVQRLELHSMSDENDAGGTVNGIRRVSGLEDAGVAIAGEDCNLITELFGDKEVSVIR
jgi:hypothetical protein